MPALGTARCSLPGHVQGCRGCCRWAHGWWEMDGAAPSPTTCPPTCPPSTPRQEAWHVCAPPCTPQPRHAAFRYRVAASRQLAMGQPHAPGPTALPATKIPRPASQQAWRPHSVPQSQLALSFQGGYKAVNTWTRLTKHSSRRKWGVCRSAPLHIVMADINSTLIILCTFQSHILKPFRQVGKHLDDDYWAEPKGVFSPEA